MADDIYPLEENERLESELSKDKNDNDKTNEKIPKVKKSGKGKKPFRSKPNIEKVEKMERKIFIIKPECESQGKGIFLTRTWQEIDPKEHLVA